MLHLRWIFARLRSLLLIHMLAYSRYFLQSFFSFLGIPVEFAYLLYFINRFFPCILFVLSLCGLSRP